MIDRSRSGYLLPDGFNVVSTAFEKVVNERHISRFSQEGAWRDMRLSFT